MFPTRPSSGSSEGKCELRHSKDDDNNDNVSDDHCEDVDGGAFCTCAVFVGRTLFLGEGMREAGAPSFALSTHFVRN